MAARGHVSLVANDATEVEFGGRTIKPVVEHANRQTVNLFGVLLPAHDIGSKDLVRRIKGAVVEVDDAEIFAEGLREVNVVLEIELEGAIRLVEAGVGLDGRLVDFEPDIAEAGVRLDRLNGLDGFDGLDWLDGLDWFGWRRH